MGTDTVHNQAEDRDKKAKMPAGHSQGETRNSVLGSKNDAPATDTATAFQSDQQYPATANDPVVSEYLEQKNKEQTTAPASDRRKQPTK